MLNIEDVTVKKMPCSGHLDELDILDAVKEGVRGIFVAACQEHNCKHLKGNTRAAHRVQRGKEILAEIGLDPGMLTIQHFASNMDRQIARAIQAFKEEMKVER